MRSRDRRSGGQAVRTTATVLLFLLTAGPPALGAQQNGPAPAGYRYGKWAAAAAAIGFTALGLQAHNRADRSFAALLDYCRNTPCAIGPDGRYTDASAESRYRAVVSGDRAARGWLVGGQVALVGAVALFVLELRHGPSSPPNIPFHGLVLEPGRVGMRVNW